MGKKSPAFQFYPKDWLSSLNVLMMTPAEEGAYIRLLCYCWDSGDCSIPDDDAALAVMSRLGEGWFKGGSTAVRKCFVPHPHNPGFLTNERMLSERQNQAEWSKKSSAGGKKSAAQRAEKKATSQGGSRVVQPTPNRPVQPNVNSATASASPSAKGVSLPGYSGEFEELWRAYPRRDGSKAEAFKSYQQAIQKGTDHGRIIEGVRELSAHADRERVEQRHLPHATTWLNQRRWESDYRTVHRAGGGSPGGDRRDAASLARDIGEDIIAKRQAARELGGAPAAGQPAGAGRADPAALPDLRQPEELRR